VHDLRDATTDTHRTVDDTPFGGGAGMVLMPEPVFATVEREQPPRPLILLSPRGRRFDQAQGHWAVSDPSPGDPAFERHPDLNADRVAGHVQ